MKKFIKLLALGAFIFLSAALQEVRATHLVGSDIIYRCLGNGRYQITVRVYRDCNGVALSTSPINVRCGSNNLQVAQTKISVRDVTGIDPRCPVQSRCTGTFPYGIEEHVFQGTIDLSSYSCCEWTISWAQNARGSNISTGMANQNFYTEAKLNKCVTPCNSSPDFTNPPVAIVCRNQDFVFNNGALDTIDAGDSLSYHWAPALINAGVQATYLPPFSPTRPITFFGFPMAHLPDPAGIHLDSITGDIRFRPTIRDQVAVLVIEVKEWRRVNGVMTVIGITRRDMQVIVIDCPNNNVPKLEGPYTKQACANQQVCMSIITDDDDPNDTVKISWNRGIPGATFTNNNGQTKHASGAVCWTPTDAHVSNIPYTFTVTAKDDACTLPGQAVRSYSIFVRETPKADRQIQLLTCGKVAIDYTPIKQYLGLSHSWVIRDSNNVGVFSSSSQKDTAFLQPGIHRVFLTLQTSTPCINIFIDSIEVPEFVRVKLPSDTFLCAGSSLQLNAQQIGGNAPFQYEWAQVLDSGVSSVISTASSYSIQPDSNVSYLVRILDGNGCRNYDSINVVHRNLPDVDLGPDQRICNGDVYLLNAGSDSLFNFLWSNGDTSAQTELKNAGIYTVKVSDELGCSSVDSFELKVTKVEMQLSGAGPVCDGDTAILTVSNANNIQWFNLAGFNPANPGTPIYTGSVYERPITQNTGLVYQGFKTEDGLTCSAFDSVKITKRELPEIVLAAQGPYCHNESQVNLTSFLQYPTLMSGDWRSDQETDIVQNNYFYPKNVDNPNPIAGHELIYRVTDNFGCTNEEKVNVKVNPLPQVVLDKNPTYCADQGVILLNSIKQMPSSTVGGTPRWYSANNNAQVNLAITGANVHNKSLNISALTPGSTYPVVFEYKASLSGCLNTDTTYIKVNVVPQTDAGFLSPICYSDQAVNLNAANPSPAGGIWTNSLNQQVNNFDPQSLDPSTAKFAIPGTYVRFYYSYTSPEGCAKGDSVDLLVKGLPELKLTALGGWCESAGLLDLRNQTNLLGGTWTGPGVSGTDFDPVTAGLGQTHTLRYSYTDASSQCSAEDQIQVFAQNQPQIELVTLDKACQGEAFPVELKLTHASGSLLSSSGDGLFGDAQSGTSTSDQQTISYYPGSQDRTQLGFSLSAVTTNNNFCPPAQATKTINIIALPQISLPAGPYEGCETLVLELDAQSNADPGAEYIWDFGDGDIRTGSDNLLSIRKEYPKYGQYTINLKVTNTPAFGSCVNNATPVQVTVLPSPEALFSMSREITPISLPEIAFFDESSIEGGASLVSWEWKFGDRNFGTSTQQNPVYTYPVKDAGDTGTYRVWMQVTADNGCTDSTSRLLIIRPEITVFIPNAFTPDGMGDSMNNRFYIVAREFKTFEVHVYTRWGEEVYRSNDINEGWDGQYKGVPAQQDVYVYRVIVTSLEGKEYEFSGTVTLLR
ncbi:MAG: T9SS type B sorting domain-containing protein [Bacteroidetes bacterium]|nr:MAG: T9SS type B sorting domain-containing protein [Bacteroidota bacterium]